MCLGFQGVYEILHSKVAMGLAFAITFLPDLGLSYRLQVAKHSENITYLFHQIKSIDDVVAGVGGFYKIP